MARHGGDIWVVCGRALCEAAHACQMISKAHSLWAQRGGRVVAVWLGHCAQPQQQEIFAHGAHRLVICESADAGEEWQPRALQELAKKENAPALAMLPATESGRLCAARLGVMLGAGLVAECIDIQLNAAQDFEFIRAAAGATVLARISCVGAAFGICTVKQNVFPPGKPLGKMPPGQAEHFNVTPDPPLPQPLITGRQKLQSHAKSQQLLQGARLVFGFGRGIGGERNIALLKEAARRYGAQVAASRGAVEAGWLGREGQVGQSGISIAPAIYLAFGISGASQHMVGLKNVQKLVAINIDDKAPIASYADYLVPGDCGKILKEMLAEKQE